MITWLGRLDRTQKILRNSIIMLFLNEPVSSELGEVHLDPFLFVDPFLFANLDGRPLSSIEDGEWVE